MATRPQASARRTQERDAQPHVANAATISAGGLTIETPISFTPVAHMVGHRSDDSRALAAIMDGVGIEHKAFENSAALTRAWSKRIPDLIILEVSGGGVDAVDTIFTLAEHKYTGALQLTGERGNLAIEGIARVAQRHSLNSLPVQYKPFGSNEIAKIFAEQKTAALQSGPSKIRLDEGLKNNWVDFWYQPKIDLRSRSLVGVESFVRLFHPQIGLVPPSVFLQDANETSMFILGQRALVHAVKTASNFAELGLNLRVAINVSVKALRTLPVSRIIQTNHPDKSKPLRLTLDVNESDVAADPSFIAQRVKLLRNARRQPCDRRFSVRPIVADRLEEHGARGTQNPADVRGGQRWKIRRSQDLPIHHRRRA